MNLSDSPSNLITVLPTGTEPPPYVYDGYGDDVSRGSGFCDWYSNVGAWYISYLHYVAYDLYCGHSNSSNESSWLQTASFPPYDPGLVEISLNGNVDTDDGFLDLFFKILGYAVTYFKTPFSVIVSGLGMVGNAIILVIFRRLSVLADCCTPILVGLAASDFTYCFLAFLRNLIDVALNFITEDHYVVQSIYAVRTLFYKPIIPLIQFTCWATTFLAFERMISVVFPFHVKRIFTPKRSCAITGGIFVLSFLANLDELLNVYLDVSDPFGVTWKRTGYVSYSWDSEAEFVNDVVFRIASIVFVITFNLIIIIRVNASKKFKTTSNTSSAPAGRNRNRENNTKKETRLTRLMIYMCVLFLVCYSPKSCFAVVQKARHTMSPVTQLVIESVSVPLFKLLELVNSAVTFVVYNTMSSKFKTERRKMCLGCRKSNDDNN